LRKGTSEQTHSGVFIPWPRVNHPVEESTERQRARVSNPQFVARKKALSGQAGAERRSRAESRRLLSGFRRLARRGQKFRAGRQRGNLPVEGSHRRRNQLEGNLQRRSPREGSPPGNAASLPYLERKKASAHRRGFLVYACCDNQADPATTIGPVGAGIPPSGSSVIATARSALRSSA
jgi:hypothetical protein